MKNKKLAVVLTVIAAGSIFYGTEPAMAKEKEKKLDFGKIEITFGHEHGRRHWQPAPPPPPPPHHPHRHMPPRHHFGPGPHMPPPPHHHFGPGAHMPPPHHGGPRPAPGARNFEAQRPQGRPGGQQNRPQMPPHH